MRPAINSTKSGEINLIINNPHQKLYDDERKIFNELLDKDKHFLERPEWVHPNDGSVESAFDYYLFIKLEYGLTPKYIAPDINGGIMLTYFNPINKKCMYTYTDNDLDTVAVVYEKGTTLYCEEMIYGCADIEEAFKIYNL